MNRAEFINFRYSELLEYMREVFGDDVHLSKSKEEICAEYGAKYDRALQSDIFGEKIVKIEFCPHKADFILVGEQGNKYFFPHLLA